MLFFRTKSSSVTGDTHDLEVFEKVKFFLRHYIQSLMRTLMKLYIIIYSQYFYGIKVCVLYRVINPRIKLSIPFSPILTFFLHSAAVTYQARGIMS